MSIVLNEHEWAKEMILSRSLGKKPYETLRRVARYYTDQNYSKKEVRKMLDAFVIQCDPSASLPKWSKTIDYALDRALKYDAIQIDYVDITKPEMDIIDGLEGRQLKRLAFTLLCLGKYWDLVNPNNDHWVINRDSDIMRLANINTSIKKQSLRYKALQSNGLIQFSKKVDNTSVRVCFMKDGEIILRISDFRNLGYQYLHYHGEPYFKCKNCGITTKYNNPNNKRSSSKQKYCCACAAEIDIQQSINSVMRQRNKVAHN